MDSSPSAISGRNSCTTTPEARASSESAAICFAIVGRCSSSTEWPDAPLAGFTTARSQPVSSKTRPTAAASQVTTKLRGTRTPAASSLAT